MPSQKGPFQRESKAELKEHGRRCRRHGSRQQEPAIAQPWGCLSRGLLL